MIGVAIGAGCYGDRPDESTSTTTRGVTTVGAVGTTFEASLIAVYCGEHPLVYI